MATEEPSSLRLAGTLAVAGLLSGLILVGVFIVTEPIIQQNHADALQRAIYKVLPGTKKIEAFKLSGDKIVPYEGKPGAPTKETLVYKGLDDSGASVGWAVPASGSGFQDTIALIYGFDPKKKAIIGMEILDSRETPGLGDKIGYDEHFRANFKALEVEPKIELVKRGEKTAPNQVDAITGATISSRAVVGILQSSTKEWVPRLGDEPAKTAAAGKGR
ncbi:MAG: FMN-binding protein [Myxococcales bacterium]|nr:FMN-binding protein [Myxococcales bacterium]MCB9580375.1 FMN-binding protein [Polyangiaceae bacterium]